MFKCIINRENENEINSPFYNVKLMLEEKFSNDINFENTIIILGYNLGKKIDFYRREYPQKKIIVYQLEQLYDNKSFWYNKKSNNNLIKERTIHIIDWLSKCDEIWDYDIDNKIFLKKEGYNNVRFFPLIYSDKLKLAENKIKTTDILFFGSINEKERTKILSFLQKKYNLKIIGDYSFINKDKIEKYNLKLENKKYGDELNKIIMDSKIVLNLHYYESKIQEQVRIFPLLINNKCVVSEKSLRNYFGELIFEFETENELTSYLDFLLKDNNWDNKKNISENFRLKNFNSIKIGASYNTFYGIKNLEKSIESIKNIVSHIVVVHQKNGFDGVNEPHYNQTELKKLIDYGYIDEIIYYEIDNNKTIHESILEKRNIGLESCKENKCEYIITLDSDELYNERELYSDIITMKKNNIGTLYNKIKTFYYSDEYFFVDNYYVPSVYKIDGRKYEKYIKTSYIVDPIRKQKENNFMLSNFYMNHHSYFIDDYIEKLNSKISFNLNKNLNSVEILNHLKSWKEGELAKVLWNDNNGNLTIKEIELNHIKKYKNNFLTIIIPTYKNTSFIDECINSVINSCQGLDVEILIGIDSCTETLDYIKNKSFDNRVRFLFFDTKVGPYIIKNSLTKIANSDVILFFDSDDIMGTNMIPTIINGMKTNDFIKPMYSDFSIKPNYNINSTNSFGEGVFAIKKDLFLSMNGFEPWPVAADSDFMGRLYKNKKKVQYTKEVVFYRRIHPNSLTQSKETGMYSSLRGKYANLSKNRKDFSPLPKLVISDFYEVPINTYTNNNINSSSTPIIVKTPKVLPLKNRKSIDYEKINIVLAKKTPPKVEEKPKVVNKPPLRNDLFEKKMSPRTLLAKQSIKKR